MCNTGSKVVDMQAYSVAYHVMNCSAFRTSALSFERETNGMR